MNCSTCGRPKSTNEQQHSRVYCRAGGTQVLGFWDAECLRMALGLATARAAGLLEELVTIKAELDGVKAQLAAATRTLEEGARVAEEALVAHERR